MKHLFLSIKNIYANTKKVEANTSILIVVTSYLFQSIEEFIQAGGPSESHSTKPCEFLRLLLPCSFFFCASSFRILAVGYETTRCSLRVSCNFDERRIWERSLLYSPFFVAAQWVDDFSFLLCHHDLLLLLRALSYDKIATVSTKIERCKSTSLVERVILRREVFVQEKREREREREKPAMLGAR